MKALVLDQSLTVRMDVARILSQQGYQVEPCGDADQARAYLARGPVDLAVLDLAPESGGLVLARELLVDNTRTTSLLLMAGSDEDVSQANALAPGPQQLLKKPYHEIEVIAAIQALQTSPQPLGKPRALVVDDSETFIALITESLRAILDMHAVNSGESALAYLADHTVDIILLDRGLPGMSGEETCRAIRAGSRNHTTPILMLTASEVDEAVISCLDAGADDFITKSGDLRVLVSRLHSQLRRHDVEVQTTRTRIAQAETEAASALAEARAGLLADLEHKNRSLERAMAEQQKAEESLRQSEEFNRTVLASIPDCMKVLDSDGRLLAMSDNGRCLLGIDDFTPYRNVDWCSFWKAEDRAAAIAAIAQAKATGLGVFQGFFANLRGEQKWWDVRIAPVRGADGQISQFIAISRDVTEEKFTQQTLERQRVELERSNADLEHFAAVAAHDLKDPLRMLSTYLTLIEHKYPDLDVKIRGYLKHACDGAQRMSKLLDGLLAYSLIATSTQETPIVIDTSLACDEAIANLLTSISEHQAHVTRDELPVIHANHMQLVQLFQNLVGNAIKFCRERTAKVHISATCDDREWIFHVADNGIGIDPVVQKQIFGMFKRLHSPAEFSGSGIGLATCKRIVERNGGRIWVDSAPGVGSTFHFALQKLLAEPAHIARPDEASDVKTDTRCITGATGSASA